MTAQIDILQAALAYIQGKTSSTYPAQNSKPENELSSLHLPPPILQQTNCTGSRALTISPPPQTPSWNSSQTFIRPPAVAGYTPAPLLTLTVQQALQQTTPTTRGYSTAPLLPAIPPTPPPTPVTNLSRFPFPPPHGYTLTTEDNTKTLPPQPLLPLPLHFPTIAPTPSPTPSPSPSPSFTCDTVSHSLFQGYLHETWPEHAIRRAGSVIQDSLYEKIVCILQGGDGNARIKQWIKRSEFFLIEKEGRGKLLAIPTTKSRVAKKGAGNGGGKSESRGSYKLVAKLDDFYYIISSYHSNKNGHPGIRRTHGMVSRLIHYNQYLYTHRFLLSVVGYGNTSFPTLLTTHMHTHRYRRNTATSQGQP